MLGGMETKSQFITGNCSTSNNVKIAEERVAEKLLRELPRVLPLQTEPKSPETKKSSPSSTVFLSEKNTSRSLKARYRNPHNHTSSVAKESYARKGGKMKKRAPFGYELVLNLFDCDREIITSKKHLKKFVDTLCKKIKMKQYGKTLLPYFGEKNPVTAGYSLVQLIETSSITGHFSDLWCSAYINIFSCKKYDQKLAKEFACKFFKAKKVTSRYLIR